MPDRTIRFLRTSMLDIAYEEHGAGDGKPVILLHGFPYDVRAYDAVAPVLAEQGCRVIVPYLRGFGATRFLSADIMRSGEQAALGRDLLELMDGLGIEKAALAGYDWGGRAACIVAALWPERVSGLVSGDGYNIQDIAGAVRPATPETEHRFWYQYYFHSPRGRRGLAENRQDLCRLLWRLWSPTWRFSDADFTRSAESFENPNFVEVVVHSYRHRFGYADGDPKLASIEAQLARQPRIGVPAISLLGGDDGVSAVPRRDDSDLFTGRHERRVLPGIGHNIPQEAPRPTAQAVLDLMAAG